MNHQITDHPGVNLSSLPRRALRFPVCPVKPNQKGHQGDHRYYSRGNACDFNEYGNKTECDLEHYQDRQIPSESFKWSVPERAIVPRIARHFSSMQVAMPALEPFASLHKCTATVRFGWVASKLKYLRREIPLCQRRSRKNQNG
jgi:hypothetical protein